MKRQILIFLICINNIFIFASTDLDTKIIQCLDAQQKTYMPPKEESTEQAASSKPALPTINLNLLDKDYAGEVKTITTRKALEPMIKNLNEAFTYYIEVFKNKLFDNSDFKKILNMLYAADIIMSQRQEYETKKTFVLSRYKNLSLGSLHENFINVLEQLSIVTFEFYTLNEQEIQSWLNEVLSFVKQITKTPQDLGLDTELSKKYKTYMKKIAIQLKVITNKLTNPSEKEKLDQALDKAYLKVG